MTESTATDGTAPTPVRRRTVLAAPVLALGGLVALATGPDLVVQRNIVYGPEADQRLDLYRLRGMAHAPLVLFVHGGGWSTGDKSWVSGGTSMRIEEWRDTLLQRGYAVAAVNYRLSDTARYPAPMQDVQAAVTYVRTHAGDLRIDADRVALAGESSGAHLALMAAYTASSVSRVRAVIDYYGFTDLVHLYADRATSGCPPVGWPGHTAEEGLLGVDPSSRAGRDTGRWASPVTAAHTGCPPTLLFGGTGDCLVPPRQPRRLADALAAAGVPHHLALVDAGHGDPVFYTSPDLQREAVDFLDTHLR